MDDHDQQFCLRWNNHQSTIISVFGTLKENEALVDCTLAAEGKFLKAHKVVLSACSPYFATLLQEQYDKHPIFILKDVKYQELCAMMDYMYHGEVNISQDQLAALLKAAESLQIKGLSDNRSTGGSTVPKQEHHRASMPPTPKLSGGYTLEQTKRARIALGPGSIDNQEMGSREGSSSPSRRRRKMGRRSIENATTDVHDNANSSQQPPGPNAAVALSGVGAITAAASALAAGTIATSLPAGASLAGTSTSLAAPAVMSGAAISGTTTSTTKKTESLKAASQQSSDAMNTDNVQGSNLANIDAVSEHLHHHSTHHHHAGDIVDKSSNHKQQKQTSKDASGSGGGPSSELVIEPKSEYDDEGNDEAVEDLTLDEEDMAIDDLDQNAGTSQGGEGSSHGYAPWQPDRSQNELLLETQEAQQRDPQDLRTLYNIATAAAAVIAAASTTKSAQHNKNGCGVNNNSSGSSSNNNINHNLQYNNTNNNNHNNSSGSNSKNNHNHSSQAPVTSCSEILLTNNSLSSTTLTMTTTTSTETLTSSLLDTTNVAATSTALLLTNSRSSSCSNTPTHLSGDLFENELSIRKIYKCCSNMQQKQQQQQQQVVGSNLLGVNKHGCSPLTENGSGGGGNGVGGNCNDCQISAAAAAASYQLANLLGSSMLLPPHVAAVNNKTANSSSTNNNNSNNNNNNNINNNNNTVCLAGFNKKMSAITNTVPCPTSSAIAAISTTNVHAIAGGVVSSISVSVPKKTNSTMFHCEFCSFSCSWKYDLKLHMRQKHGIHNKKM
ncbi:longitudinals lacking isoform 7-T7 [Glossina fuscipes fuscipes]